MTTQVARKKDARMEQMMKLKRSQEYHTVKMTLEMGRQVIQSMDVRGLVIIIGTGVMVTLNLTMKDRVVIVPGLNIQHQMEQEKYNRIAVVSRHMIHKAKARLMKTQRVRDREM
jgi:UDP-3-O-[3-hydroxymyristoyl] glucosamine N-acyltransferase